MRVGIAALPLLFASVLAAQTMRIPGPVEAVASAEQLQGWSTFDLVPATTGTRLEIDRPIGSIAPRIDVFVRRNGEWLLRSSHKGADPLLAPLPRETRVGVLLRDRRRRDIYAWGEADGTRDTHVVLQWFRTISVSTTDQTKMSTVFVTGKEPLMGGSEIRWVPLGVAIVCTHGNDSSTCAIASDTQTSVDLQGPSSDVRILRLDAPEYELTLLAPGATTVRARVVPFTPLRAVEWLAIELRRGDDWSNVVIDRHASGTALERVTGATLSRLPSFTAIASQDLKGIVVRPLIGNEPYRVETDDQLYFYDANASEPMSHIPVAVATPNVEGLFAADELPSGSYRLSLISAAAAAGPTTASLTPGIPVSVEFPPGPRVRGRVVRSSGAGPADPTTVELIKRGTMGKGRLDPSEAMRATTASDDGSFHVVVPSPGYYRLRIRWGAARAERDFELRRDQKEIDLGEIPLALGPTLRGTVRGCGGGTLGLAPLPDVASVDLPFFEFRRVAVDELDTFFSNDLAAGIWAVSAKCGGATAIIEPATVNLPEQGEVFIDFRIIAAH